MNSIVKNKVLSLMNKSHVLFAATLMVFALMGCRDKEKEADNQLAPALEMMDPLLQRDVKQLREHLAEGAKVLGKQLDDDPAADPAGLQRAIKKARASVHDLAVSKGTFFVFVEPAGVVVRSETDPDLAAGESLFKEVPDAKKFFAAEGVTEVFGSMHGLRGYEKGGDEQWFLGHPVKDADGKVKGAFVTGWSLRMYANYLEDHVRRHLQKTAPDPSKPIPLVYVFMLRGSHAWGGKLTPDVNAQALAELDLLGSLGDGMHKTSLVIEERKFLIAAKKVPELGADVGLAVMASPL
jgi:hypothetical protein